MSSGAGGGTASGIGDVHGGDKGRLARESHRLRQIDSSLPRPPFARPHSGPRHPSGGRRRLRPPPPVPHAEVAPAPRSQTLSVTSSGPETAPKWTLIPPNRASTAGPRLPEGHRGRISHGKHHVRVAHVHSVPSLDRARTEDLLDRSSRAGTGGIGTGPGPEAAHLRGPDDGVRPMRRPDRAPAGAGHGVHDDFELRLSESTGDGMGQAPEAVAGHLCRRAVGVSAVALSPTGPRPRKRRAAPRRSARPRRCRRSCGTVRRPSGRLRHQPATRRRTRPGSRCPVRGACGVATPPAIPCILSGRPAHQHSNLIIRSSAVRRN